MQPECADVARSELHSRYAEKLVVNSDLDRTLVSFQANKELPFYSWFKYKEGFAKPFVDYCINSFGDQGELLDPFAGSGAALFVAAERGMSATGIELLPSATFSIEARMAALEVDPEKFRRYADRVLKADFESMHDESTAIRHVKITEKAYSEETERDLSGYLYYVRNKLGPKAIKTLLEFAAFSVLEEISFTRKDGQYLRWDQRAGKSEKTKFDKGEILSFRKAVEQKLSDMKNDLLNLTRDGNQKFLVDTKTKAGEIELIQGTCLHKLRGLPSDRTDLVITSPPYCNRLDYTRTYCLELTFLGCSESKIKMLRQTMLSCTVENKSKVGVLRRYYRDKGDLESFELAKAAFESQEGFHEVWSYLDSLIGLKKPNGKKMLPNENVPRMIWNYFFEMNLVIQQLARVLKPGGRVVMVNDNVQYAGEELPVDLILSDYAEAHGLEIETIWVLPRGKGNASQQMGKHGRTEIRKCVYVWKKSEV